MMTPQEIIKEIQKLPPIQQKEVVDSVSEVTKKTSTSEEEFLQILFAEGVIGNLPDLAKYTDKEDDFEPIEILGKPTSEIVIEERR